MLNMSKSTNYSGLIEIDGTSIVSLVYDVREDGTSNYNESILNGDMYTKHKDDVDKQIADFKAKIEEV